jgi:G protein beta subunit-like protein
VALDGSMVVAANNHGTCYVWRMLRGTSLTTHFEPLHKLRAHQVWRHAYGACDADGRV